jgi:prepilin-type N-terminal cleavage/methylation domain
MPPTPFSPRRGDLSQSAFTLIELLTVIAIIGILAAIVIASVSKVRETARKAQCISKVRQLVVGTVAYGNDNRGRPPHPNLTNDGSPTFSGTPHFYSAPAYDQTLRSYLGDRFEALYTSERLAQIDSYNPQIQKEAAAGGQEPYPYVHFSYFQRSHVSGGTGTPVAEYADLFKDLRNPPMQYALWGTLAFRTTAKTLAYAEANNDQSIPLSGMFAGYADGSVSWVRADDLVRFSNGGYYWPRPKGQPR